MKSVEICINTNTVGSELAADILFDNGSSGVAIYDSADVAELIKSDIIWDYIDESLLVTCQSVLVKGYVPKENFDTLYPLIMDGLDKLQERSEEYLGSLEVTCAEVDDEDWLNTWKKFYKPIKIGRVTVVPKWLKYECTCDEKIVFIDPGMAFGTGEHESTQLCIELLQELDVEGKSVLDIGTGSGILGIAAARLGASSVLMSDIDEVAVKAAKTNAACNDLAACDVTIKQCDLVKDGTARGQIVLANITADILIKLSNDIARCLDCGGYMIISGIINARYQEVLDAYIAAGLKLDKALVKGEWSALRLVL